MLLRLMTSSTPDPPPAIKPVVSDSAAYSPVVATQGPAYLDDGGYGTTYSANYDKNYAGQGYGAAGQDQAAYGAQGASGYNEGQAGSAYGAATGVGYGGAYDGAAGAAYGAGAGAGQQGAYGAASGVAGAESGQAEAAQERGQVSTTTKAKGENGYQLLQAKEQIKQQGISRSLPRTSLI